MTKIEEYREILRSLDNWDAYLLEQSGLPGPRSNLELAQAAAEVAAEGGLEADSEVIEPGSSGKASAGAVRLQRYRDYTPDVAPVNSPKEFLAFVGVLGLGQALARGDPAALQTLRPFAADPRWRLREAVAMALQCWGDQDMDALLKVMADWSQGSFLEQRAAAAALCEPRLLQREERARRVIDLLDGITTSLVNTPADQRKGEDFQALKKGLGYCWSVAVAALPDYGKPLLEKWLADPDKDAAWIMKENLKKKRLERLDPEWTARRR